MIEDIALADGRVARRVENRARIIGALFSLVRSGRPHPTLKEIAERAGVTPRTLLNHFPDMGALLVIAQAEWREQAKRDIPPIPDISDPEECVREFFRRATRFYEIYSAIRWALLTTSVPMPTFDQRQHKGVVLSLLERRVMELVSRLGTAIDDDAELRRGVLVAIDPLAWRLLRVQQGLSRADAAATMARGVIVLARGGKAPRRSRK
jgi:AcrR family transcriptional regulator